MAKKPVYRIKFYNQESIYEIYARHIGESDMFGFIEVEEFVFGKHTSVVVDPSEEKLKSEFADIKRTYIPMHSVIRIDEVGKEGISKMTESKQGQGNISVFPRNPYAKRDDN